MLRDTLGPPVPTLPVPESVAVPDKVIVALATEEDKIVTIVDVWVLCAIVMVERTEEALDWVIVETEMELELAAGPPRMGISPL